MRAVSAALFFVLAAGCSPKFDVSLEVRNVPADVVSLDISVFRGACPQGALQDRALNVSDPNLVRSTLIERGGDAGGSFLIEAGQYCVVVLGRDAQCVSIATFQDSFTVDSLGDQPFEIPLCSGGRETCVPLDPDFGCGPAVTCLDGRGICDHGLVDGGMEVVDAMDSGVDVEAGPADASVCELGEFARSCTATKPCETTCRESFLCAFEPGHVFSRGNACEYDVEMGVATPTAEPVPLNTTGEPTSFESALLFPCFFGCVQSEGNAQEWEECARCCASNEPSCELAEVAACVARTCVGLPLATEAQNACLRLDTTFDYMADDEGVVAAIDVCRAQMQEQTGVDWFVTTPLQLAY